MYKNNDRVSPLEMPTSDILSIGYNERIKLCIQHLVLPGGHCMNKCLKLS